VILTLTWKEYREHRSIWLTMVIMTGVMGLGLAQLVSPFEGEAARTGLVALTVLGMAGAYGLVCGAMMFAGEREAGTMVFLDIFLGRRGLLWFCKFLIGVVWALSEALAVALVLHFFKQAAPLWLPMLVGQGQQLEFHVHAQQPPAPALWFLVLPVVTLEAYAWGLLGSGLTRRVLSGAALATLMVAPLWLLTIFTPAPVFLGVRIVAAGLALFLSSTTLLTQSREPVQRASPRPAEPHPMQRRVQDWDGGGKFDLERRAPEVAWGDRPTRAKPLPLPETLARPPRPVRRGRRPAQAHSPGQVLFWLALRQAQVLFWILMGACLLAGLFVPAYGQVLWPVATLLLGVACGTAAFSQEQSDLSYQFLGAEHFPLQKFWQAKILFWFAVAVLLALVTFAGGGLTLLVQSLSAPHGDRPHLNPDPFGMPERRPHVPPAPIGYDFGRLPGIIGPVSFFGIWLVYGFCLGQVFVLFCRKSVLAVLLASLVSAAALGLWLPTLLCRGMMGWQAWLAPLAMLVATRLAVRAWVGGRIKERRPLALMIGFGAAGLVWAVLNYGFRAWEIADVGEPMDRKAFRALVPFGRDNAAGLKIEEALGEIDNREGEGPWQARLAEAAHLPLGVIGSPPSEGPSPTPRHLPAARTMTTRVRTLAENALKTGKPESAFNYLAQLLMLSRTLRHKAPLASYRAGIETESSALDGLDLWLAAGKPSPDLLRRVLDELNRHAAETPSPLDCLQTECLRAGGVLDNPATWTFHPAPGNVGEVRQSWLANSIVLSLETPWEKERRIRLWRAVWAGLFRGIQTPYWEWPESTELPPTDKETTRHILRGWLPAAEEGTSLTAARLAPLLDASWLSDERLFAPVLPLRSAATRARWRVEACRLRVALALYQLQEGKSAATLDALVPNYLRQLPVDPYSGQPFHYRISRGEHIQINGREHIRGREGPDKGLVHPGQGVLWSTGPDRVDHGGRKDGDFEDDDPRWASEGFDLIELVPYWP
jgi:hypothetical protein